MEFTEKLTRLTAEVNKTSIAKAAGLPPTAISNYISRKYIPAADKALSIAKALRVPLEWLVDDSMDFPPPSEDSHSLNAIPDDVLMAEACRRLANQAAKVHAIFQQIESEDWNKHANELVGIPLANSLPEKFEPVMRLLYLCQRLPQMLKEFDASVQMKQIGIKGSPPINVLLYDVTDLAKKKDTDIHDAEEYRQLRELADAHARLGDDSAVKGLEVHRNRLWEKRRHRKLDTSR